VNQRRRRRLARLARQVLDEDVDILYVIPTWTTLPSENWFVAVTHDEFIVFGVDALCRPKAVEARTARTQLAVSSTVSGGRVVLIGTDAHNVHRFHLQEIAAQNRELANRRST
jgi:hypothetical protein